MARNTLRLKNNDLHRLNLDFLNFQERSVNYSECPLTGPTRTGPMLLKNKIIDILKIHVKPRDQFSRTHEIYLKKYT